MSGPDGTLLRAVRHNAWANAALIAFCAGRPAAELAWTAPGTFGTIHATLQHLVGAEQNYLFRLTGKRPPIEEERGRAALGDDRLVPLDELAERARSTAERMERVLADGLDPDRVVPTRVGTATAGIIAAQLIHHGSDHRAHVGTILGAHGVEAPDLDVWAYGRSIGEEVITQP